WTFRRLTAADIRAPGRFLDALRRTFLRLGADAPAPDAWRGAAGAELSRPRPRPAPRPRPRPHTRPRPCACAPARGEGGSGRGPGEDERRAGAGGRPATGGERART